MADSYDLIVVGSGQAGGPLAKAFAKAGRKALLVEREHVGGTCINVGCTPTKTMVASGRNAYLTRRGTDFGVRTGSVSVDMAKVRQRKRDIVDRFRNGSQEGIEKAGGELVFGTASFVDAHTIHIALNDGGDRRATAPAIVLDTGGRPRPLDLDGIAGLPVLDSTSIMELAEVPPHLLVVGGGYIALEFAQLFRRLGSEVTIIQRGKQLLSREDPDVAQAVLDILREDGIDVRLDTSCVQARGSSGTVELVVEAQGRQETVRGSHLLNAIGRVPNTEALNLQAAGVRTNERSEVPVNQQLETNVPGIYAVGDVKGGPAFTHISYDDFRILRTNLLQGGSATTTGRLVPYVVYIDPELGRVGMTGQEARDSGREFRVAKMPMRSVARALEMDESRGLMKVIVDAQTDEILGCAMLGIFGGELMSMVEIAMMAKLPYTALREGIFAHPTLAESLNNLFTSWE